MYLGNKFAMDGGMMVGAGTVMGEPCDHCRLMYE